jgi:hypothetical protein
VIQRVEPGSRAAVKKYYEPTALLFIEDWDSTPADQRRYFIHTHFGTAQRYAERVYTNRMRWVISQREI